MLNTHLLTHWKAVAQYKYHNKRWNQERANKRQRSNGKCCFQNETMSPGNPQVLILNLRRAWLWNLGLQYMSVSVTLCVAPCDIYSSSVEKENKIPTWSGRLSKDSISFINHPCYPPHRVLLSNFLFPTPGPVIMLFSMDHEGGSLCFMHTLFPICSKYHQL